jgi:hypothetical protein
LIYLVNSLLCGKLGVSDPLEHKAIAYTAFLRALVLGTVKHPDHDEYTAMLNAVVVVNEGASLFPSSTASYSHMIWCPVDRFFETARQKDPLLLHDTLTPIQYCIHGLCIKSAFNVLAGYTDAPFYPYEAYH